MKTHNLKLSIDFCGAVLSGEKTFEVRKNDRGFQTGDLIRFIPTDGTSYRYPQRLGNKERVCCAGN